MSWQVWLLFAVTETFLCLSPGPAVLFVISNGLSRGGGVSLWANAGILTGNTLYFLLSAFGLGAMLLASHDLFTMMKYAGAAYLVFLGVQTLRGSGLASEPTRALEVEYSGWKTLARGFALQVANPKALVFFVALLPQFIDARHPIAPQVAILAITSVRIRCLKRVRLSRWTRVNARTPAEICEANQCRQRRHADRRRSRHRHLGHLVGPVDV
jgi:homoserine/homoserine lactone efflux protein